MLKDQYRRMNEQIAPDEALIRETASAAARTAVHIRKARIRPILVFAALLVCFALAVPVFAASPAGYKILYSISPAAAQYFKPVNQSCEDNGIRMTVDSVYLSENAASFHISLQDLTGDRIDETTDLLDSYTLYSVFDYSTSCKLIQYNRQTRTAKFLVSIFAPDGHPIEGDKLTFSLRRFLSGKQEFEGELSGIDLTDVTRSSRTISAELRGWNGCRPHSDRFTALPPGEPLYSPVSGVDVTGLGYVDGKLHIQLCYADVLQTDNHGYIWLQTADGTKISDIGSGSFWDDKRKNCYEEYIFDVDPEQLASCTVYGYFVTCDALTEGNWEITFALEETE
ncbi:MAG: DUF4179 domain-containing protein [Hominenteromicrobium sp.]